MKNTILSALIATLILASACGKSPSADGSSSAPAAEKSALKQAAESIGNETSKAADTVVKEAGKISEVVKNEAQKVIDDATKLFSNAKLADASSLLEKLGTMKLSPDQEGLVQRLKEQIKAAMASAGQAAGQVGEQAKAEAQKLIDQAKKYISESKFADANKILEKLGSFQLSPEHKQIVDQLKQQVDKALAGASKLTGDGAKALGGLLDSKK